MCFVHPGYVAPDRSEGCTIINVVRVGGNNGWLDREGVLAADGNVVLYKKVSEEFLTQEGTPNETRWEIGKEISHPSWNPTVEECGPAKFHACSRPYFCDEFRSGGEARYIAIRIAVSDLFAWDNGSYPHKIAFRAGTVLHECDRFGKEIGAREKAC